MLPIKPVHKSENDYFLSTGGHTLIPLSGEMGEDQKVIPFLREMSLSDKRFADVLRLPLC